MQHITQELIQSFETRYRAAFVNSLSGFKSACLVGTRNAHGQENLAIFSQVFHLGANPALMGMIVRPPESPRHTLDNLLATGYFTLNHIKPEFYQQAHQTSARYPEDVSEFEAVGLTPYYSEKMPAPYVAEADVRIGLQLAETHTLAINQTVLVIGRVIEVFLPEHCLMPDGFIDLEAAQTVTTSSLDSYHTTKKIGRLRYAKTDKPPQAL